MRDKTLSVVIPVFNEEPVIERTYQRLHAVMEDMPYYYELLFVDDGSTDRSLEILEGIADGDDRVHIVSFSRNFGHQAAVMAGIEYAAGDAVVLIDADLQDPPEVIPQMVEKWREGYDVVYGKRTKRKGESVFKKVTAHVFYRFLRSMTDTDIPADTGDFRLMDKRVCEWMRLLREKRPFVRGLVRWVGFRQTSVAYVREERAAGETKYPLKKMLALATDGIFSFSYKPLKLAGYAGFALSFASFVYLIVGPQKPLGRSSAGRSCGRARVHGTSPRARQGRALRSSCRPRGRSGGQSRRGNRRSSRLSETHGTGRTAGSSCRCRRADPRRPLPGSQWCGRAAPDSASPATRRVCRSGWSSARH